MGMVNIAWGRHKSFMESISAAFNAASSFAREFFSVLGEQRPDRSHLLRVWQWSLCNAADPAALNRPLNDPGFALDHFGVKLFNIAENVQTKAGQALAGQRARTMRSFVSTP